MTFDLEAHVRALSELHAPSGYEKPVRDYLRETWQNWIDSYEVDGLGSLIAIKNGSGSEPRRRIMLAAHSDEIGMAVMEIRDGYLRVSETAGIDARTLQAQPVIVHGRRDLPGIFAAVPPHISKSTGAGRKNYPNIEEQWIDVGLPAQEVAELVQAGDLVTYDASFLKLKNGLFAGKAMDDRASVAAVSYCLYLLQRRIHDWDVYAVATAQEETHLLGATTAAYAVNPDVAIAIDVTFAKQPGVSADYFQEPGKGLSLSTGPNFHPLLLDRIQTIAKENEIPFVVEPLSGNSGTDAWAIQVAHEGVPTALFSIPVRNMHSPVETVSLKDIKRVGRLMAEFITVLDDELLEDMTWKLHQAESDEEAENGEGLALMMLKELSEAIGVSGAEDEVRSLIIDAVENQVDDLHIDSMGNLIAFKEERVKEILTCLIAAHMDEVGFMVTEYDNGGYLVVESVGGIDDKLLPAMRVVVGKDKVPGVFMWKPIHLGRSRDIVSLKDMRIDIGASSKDAAKSAAPVGTRVAFDSRYIELSETTVRGKALDDRAGCAELIDLIQGDPLPFDLYAAFTVQEEVGLRGAKVIAAATQPDFALVLETTACHETPQSEDEPDVTTVTKLGRGPAITYMDRTSIVHPGLLRHFVGAAEAEGIPHQFRSPQFAGGNDAGSIHISGAGVPTVSISLPCRYLHSPYSIISLDDYQSALTLVRAGLIRMTPAVLER